MRAYAIGDIHGQLGKLIEAHDRIARDRAATGDTGAPVLHLGDLVDRGPDARGVIDHLMQGQATGQPWIVLKGNHDRMFGLFLDNPAAQDDGLRHELSYLHPRIGGGATLASYGVANPADRPIPKVHADAISAVPAAHRAWLAALPVMHRLDAALFVHAGIRPAIPFDQQSETDLLWIREPFLSDPTDHGALIVHGHTVVPQVTHYGNRLNLDTGAGYGNPLSAVVIEGAAVHLLTETGRVPVATP